MNITSNIGDLFENSSSKFPKKIAIITTNAQYTYEQVDLYSQTFSKYLSDIGVKRGDVVAVKMRRSLSMIISIIES